MVHKVSQVHLSMYLSIFTTQYISWFLTKLFLVKIGNFGLFFFSLNTFMVLVTLETDVLISAVTVDRTPYTVLEVLLSCLISGLLFDFNEAWFNWVIQSSKLLKCITLIELYFQIDIYIYILFGIIHMLDLFVILNCMADLYLLHGWFVSGMIQYTFKWKPPCSDDLINA